MTDPRCLRISDFSYPLPDEHIAKYPLAERDRSKLLLWRSDHPIEENIFHNLPQYLSAGQLLIFNNTRVIYARLRFRKPTGGQVEIFCLEPRIPSDYQQSFATGGSVVWTCLVGGARKWKEGELVQEISIGGRQLLLRASRGEAHGNGFDIRLSWDDTSVTFAEILDTTGELPIPPYLNRATEASDKSSYQTVYSKIKGSVAAPTAGLHFTPAMLADLDRQGIERDEVTLHVGAGTFKPVKSEEIGGHDMHSEWICVQRETIARLLRHNCECTAVGTTSVRTLESLYHLGVLVTQNPDTSPDTLHVRQWTPYDEPSTLSTETALQALLHYMDIRGLPTLHATTQILIAPGYTFRVVRRMITNFHQPQSTLLLLVSAFTGGRWREIYDFALRNGFRFLSYGDSSLLERPNT